MKYAKRLLIIFPSFVKAHNNVDNTMVVISQQTLMYHLPFGFTSRIQVTIKRNEYEAYVMMMKWESGDLKTISDVRELCSKFFSKLQLQILSREYCKSHYYEAIHFNIRSVRQTSTPLARVDSVNCKLWFLVASNTPSV